MVPVKDLNLEVVDTKASRAKDLPEQKYPVIVAEVELAVSPNNESDRPVAAPPTTEFKLSLVAPPPKPLVPIFLVGWYQRSSNRPSTAEV